VTIEVGQPVADADAAAGVLGHLDDGAWALAALLHLLRSGALSASGWSAGSPEDQAAARALAAIGLMVEDAGGWQPAAGLANLLSDGTMETRREGAMSSLRQLAAAVGIVAAADGSSWGGQDDATLLAQGRASALGGRMLASFVVPALAGLGERFAGGGDFLDVGVGVGELAAAFCESLPGARVVGIDVLPRALDLARRTIEDRGLRNQLELRLQPVQELDDIERFDLAWLPAPFIPEAVFAVGADRVHAALRPGGWLIVGAGRFDGDQLAVAVTRWKTVRAGGTAISADEARTALETAGFAEFIALPTPPGAPALYAARRPLPPTPRY
jgi:SAM-dependent methyltransferase